MKYKIIILFIVKKIFNYLIELDKLFKYMELNGENDTIGLSDILIKEKEKIVKRKVKEVKI